MKCCGHNVNIGFFISIIQNKTIYSKMVSHPNYLREWGVWGSGIYLRSGTTPQFSHVSATIKQKGKKIYFIG